VKEDQGFGAEDVKTLEVHKENADLGEGVTTPEKKNHSLSRSTPSSEKKTPTVNKAEV